jgi:hypothetical protein
LGTAGCFLAWAHNLNPVSFLEKTVKFRSVCVLHTSIIEQNEIENEALLRIGGREPRTDDLGNTAIRPTTPALIYL